jgi:hypothetical protein
VKVLEWNAKQILRTCITFGESINTCTGEEQANNRSTDPIYAPCPTTRDSEHGNEYGVRTLYRVEHVQHYKMYKYLFANKKGVVVLNLQQLVQKRYNGKG